MMKTKAVTLGFVFAVAAFAAVQFRSPFRRGQMVEIRFPMGVSEWGLTDTCANARLAMNAYLALDKRYKAVWTARYTRPVVRKVEDVDDDGWCVFVDLPEGNGWVHRSLVSPSGAKAKSAKPPDLDRARARPTAAVEAASQPVEGMDKADAYSMAEEYIKRQLKAPSSAKFPSLLWDVSEVRVTKTATGSYRVTGWVDSQNSFGAMLRKTWICEVQPTIPGHMWRVTGPCGVIE